MSSQLYVHSPVGWLLVEGSVRGVTAIQFKSQRDEDSAEIPRALQECAVQLREYFAGKRKHFDVLLDFGGATEFYREVWNLVKAIPYGRTRSYSDIAHNLERPNATRAVGQANGRNPIPIIVPCHRVIGKNGKLTGYAYGLQMKEALLALESPRTYAHQTALFEVN